MRLFPRLVQWIITWENLCLELNSSSLSLFQEWEQLLQLSCDLEKITGKLPSENKSILIVGQLWRKIFAPELNMQIAALIWLIKFVSTVFFAELCNDFTYFFQLISLFAYFLDLFFLMLLFVLVFSALLYLVTYQFYGRRKALHGIKGHFFSVFLCKCREAFIYLLLLMFEWILFFVFFLSLLEFFHEFFIMLLFLVSFFNPIYGFSHQELLLCFQKYLALLETGFS